ncbi:MAG: histidine biosynthesis bifunctional protein HisIE [Herpetosiphonaceae bacterium]|nr:MAG: histidine biosynthesis bifunctional protein HisIE [Herpetosiphonaceae bacterium]
MLGYMNQAALSRTQETGLVTFWSRSRGELWQKGATSGNVLRLVELRVDCDGDALLVLAEPAGPTCHTGSRSCFHRTLEGATHDEPAPQAAFLVHLLALIRQRGQERPEGSYTTYLLEKGVDTICKKIGEEAAEVIIAAKNGAPNELSYELADLIYHSLVLLVQQGVDLETIWKELYQRHQ